MVRGLAGRQEKMMINPESVRSVCYPARYGRSCAAGERRPGGHQLGSTSDQSAVSAPGPSASPAFLIFTISFPKLGISLLKLFLLEIQRRTPARAALAC